MTFADTITSLFQQGSAAPKTEARAAFLELRQALSAGRVRAAEPDPTSPTGWRVNVWVKQGILLGFRHGDNVDMGIGRGRWSFIDKDTMPMQTFEPSAGIRIVPGGSAGFERPGSWGGGAF